MRTLKNKAKIIPLIFTFLFLSTWVVNYLSYGAYQQKGILFVIPVDACIFLLMGTVLLGISYFTFVQLSEYKTGKLFAIYALLLGLSISLAPCNCLNEPIITFFRLFCTAVSSYLLFRIIGYLTLSTQKKTFRVFHALLCAVIAIIVGIQIISLLPTDILWVYVIASGSMSSCVFFSAIFSLIVMLTNYKKNNGFAKKQTKVLLAGIGAGVILFAIASLAPNIYLVQPQSNTGGQQFVELNLMPGDTVLDSIPLLLISGISIAIIFMLLRREFVLKDTQLKLVWFVITPCYFLIPVILLVAYTNCSPWLLMIIMFFLSIPLLTVWNKKRKRLPANTEEQTYQWRLIEEVEKEKHELSSYLHDEVLQSLIAFYRKVQADTTGRYSDMKKPLSDLIAEIRGVSHNLYPTMVEDLGLDQSLQIFISELQTKYPDKQIEYQYDFKDGILPKALAMTLYRITKELITNAAKHSEGQEISCYLHEDESGFYVRVQDNGLGFSLPNNEDLLHAPHMGLYTVKKQILALHGQISFQSSEHTGTDYHIFFPKEAQRWNIK